MRAGIRLAGDTLRFHWSNLTKGPGQPTAFPIRRYDLVNRSGDTWDTYLRPMSGDFFIFYEVFLDESYRLPDWLAASSQTILDLGANVGFTSLYFSRVIPAARFVCVEPDPGNLDVLRKNVAALGDRVRIIEGAVAAETARRGFHRGETWAGGLAGPEASKESSGVVGSVQCYSMRDTLERSGLERIDLVKMDIEGAEKEIFAGELSWLRQVGSIMIELHPGFSLEAFKKAVEPYDFRVFEAGSACGNRVTLAVSEALLDLTLGGSHRAP